MAKKKAEVSEEKDEMGDFTDALIGSLNKDAGERIAFNLSRESTAIDINRWISTQLLGLDYIVSNRRGGGLPEGRIIEIAGPPSIGKSHLAIQIAKTTQALGGLVVYIDSEIASTVENFIALGIDISNRFVFVQEQITEKVLETIERVIVKAQKIIEKKVPVTVIWDTVAASIPQAQVEGNYDPNSSGLGLKARVLSVGIAKINRVIALSNVTLVCINQIREQPGVMFTDPRYVPGGKAIPFYASVRIMLDSGKALKHDGEIIGIQVTAKTIKNKVAPPFRKIGFEIHFGVGVFEHEQLFNEINPWMKKNGPVRTDDHEIHIGGDGSWKTLQVNSNATGEVLIEKKFHKGEFDKIIADPEYHEYVLAVLDAMYIKNYSALSGAVDPESLEEALEARRMALEIDDD